MARYKLVFPNQQAMAAATAIDTPGLHDKVINTKRNIVSVELDDPARQFESITAAASARSPLAELAGRYGAEIVVDFQYDLEPVPEFLIEAATDQAEASLDDVLTLIGADKAHMTTRGKGVTLCIVDTGVDGSHPEFPAARRAGGWAPVGEDPWTDWQGHGTMCMAIAGASRGRGSRYLGVAPEASLFSARTAFFDSELTAIYDVLTERARAGEKIVASNSFGLRTGTPPHDPGPGSQFQLALDEAIEAGVLVVFSAGNNHQLAGGAPTACAPNSIWHYKSRDDLLAVATCDLDRRMWFYSSRGPGQRYGSPGTNSKPDVTAPTPRNGKILYGPGERVLAVGWGTSGACPQVAGLAALIWSLQPDLPASRVFDLIRDTSVDLGPGATCQGKGLIDCSSAVGGLATA